MEKSSLSSRYFQAFDFALRAAQVSKQEFPIDKNPVKEISTQKIDSNSYSQESSKISKEEEPIKKRKLENEERKVTVEQSIIPKNSKLRKASNDEKQMMSNSHEIQKFVSPIKNTLLTPSFQTKEEKEGFNIAAPKKSLENSLENNEENFKQNLFADFNKRKLSDFQISKDEKVIERQSKRLQKLKSIEDTCAICLNPLKDVDCWGSLPCNHRFCFNCIREWSEVTNLCPFCKREFKQITKKHQRETTLIPVAKKKQIVDLPEFEIDERCDDTCFICGNSNNFSDLIVCDNCDYICAHYRCAGFRRIPADDWFCDVCQDEKWFEKNM